MSKRGICYLHHHIIRVEVLNTWNSSCHGSISDHLPDCNCVITWRIEIYIFTMSKHKLYCNEKLFKRYNSVYSCKQRHCVSVMCKYLFISFFNSEDTWLSLTGLTNIWKILEYTKTLFDNLVVFWKSWLKKGINQKWYLHNNKWK